MLVLLFLNPSPTIYAASHIYSYSIVSRLFYPDSTVLAHIITTLNARYDYGLNLFLLSIDEGITGYRDDSLEVMRV